MSSKPGRGFARQAPDQPISARVINQGLPVLEALQRMGVGPGMAQQDGPGGIPLLRSISRDLVRARITAAPTNGGHPWKAQYFKIDKVANTRTWVDLPTTETDATANSKDPIYEWDDGVLPIGLPVPLVREAHSGALIFIGEGLVWPARAPAGGIPAISGNTPGGTGTFSTFYTWNKISFLLASQTATVRNPYTTAVAASKFMWVVLRGGTWMVGTEACT